MTESRTLAPSAPPTIAAADGISSTPAGVAASAAHPATDALQQQVFELVRARVLQSIGAGGNWTVTFRRSGDSDTFFSDTMAEMIAWDVAAQLVPPTVPNRARLVG